MKLSDYQVDVIRDLLIEDIVWSDVPQRTQQALMSKEAIVEGAWMPTEAAIIASGLPTYNQPVMELTKPLVYGGITFKKGTVIMLTFAHNHKDPRKRVVEGFVNMNGELKAVRVYRQPTARFYDLTMPDIRLMKQDKTSEI